MYDILERIVHAKRGEIAAAKHNRPLEEVAAKAAEADPPRDFFGALADNPPVRLIAEVKKASPSKGVIREDFDPVEIAKTYEAHGASCISVLTDQEFFQGHLDFLTAVRAAVAIPVLRKDFLVDPYQIYEARAAGADAVLLIAECLEGDLLQELHDLAVELGMTPLVELHQAENVDRVVATGAKLIGINNRDLNTFETDLGHTARLRGRIPADRVVVGESGIGTHEDILKLGAAGVGAVLVGETLTRNPDIGAAVDALLG